MAHYNLLLALVDLHLFAICEALEFSPGFSEYLTLRYWNHQPYPTGVSLAAAQPCG
jgi:hypothetical protein